MTHAEASSITRRRFVGGLGVLAGSTFAGSFPSEVFAASARGMRLGVLLPKRLASSQTRSRFVAGLAAGLDFASGTGGRLRTNVVTRETGVSAEQIELDARFLFERRGVSAVAALMNPAYAGYLAPLLSEKGKPFILADAGANVSPAAAVPNLVGNTFGYWQSSFAMGRWAAENLGKRCFACCSLFESGFDSPYAFQMGFESAGGTMLGLKATHVDPEAPGIDEALSAASEARPDFIFASYSGAAAIDFMRAKAQRSLKIPVVASGFMVDDTLLRAMGRAATGTISCLPWSRYSAEGTNPGFLRAFSRRSRLTPDASAVLGFDTAIMAVAATLRGGSAALHGAALLSPRGRITIGSDGFASSPLYLREVRQVKRVYRNVVIGELGSTASIDAHASSVRPDLRTGWLEPHLGA